MSFNHSIGFKDYGRATDFQQALKERGCKNIRLTTVHNRKYNDLTWNVSVPDQYYEIAKEIGWIKKEV